eukprot:XP_001707879.1 Hypothetical protein GL50803_102132 [Giardia lamblia ATCC 50803]
MLNNCIRELSAQKYLITRLNVWMVQEGEDCQLCFNSFSKTRVHAFEFNFPNSPARMILKKALSTPCTLINDVTHALYYLFSGMKEGFSH